MVIDFGASHLIEDASIEYVLLEIALVNDPASIEMPFFAALLVEFPALHSVAPEVLDRFPLASIEQQFEGKFGHAEVAQVVGQAKLLLQLVFGEVESLESRVLPPVPAAISVQAARAAAKDGLHEAQQQVSPVAHAELA